MLLAAFEGRLMIFYYWHVLQTIVEDLLTAEFSALFTVVSRFNFFLRIVGLAIALRAPSFSFLSIFVGYKASTQITILSM